MVHRLHTTPKFPLSLSVHTPKALLKIGTKVQLLRLVNLSQNNLAPRGLLPAILLGC